MNTSNYYGDSVEQHGDGNIGMIKNSAHADPQVAFREMIAAVQVLRGQVSPADRTVIDDSLNELTAGAGDESRFRRALAAIAGVATVVGGVGVPVVEAVQRVAASLTQ
ncbi:hypothetical protein ACIBBB_24055 [Streptomyces sp. NPDC051217]|uniref:hypothetical protein n=1 Tax=Streptomyces sp. NPDC051217 TaxID=3365644 RepID=UPI00379BA432